VLGAAVVTVAVDVDVEVEVVRAAPARAGVSRYAKAPPHETSAATVAARSARLSTWSR
jgi:hypothetical protein